LQFAFGAPQQILGLLAVAGHVVVIGSASTFHLMDRLVYVSVDCIQIAPVMDEGEGSAGHEGQAQSTITSVLFKVFLWVRILSHFVSHVQTFKIAVNIAASRPGSSTEQEPPQDLQPGVGGENLKQSVLTGAGHVTIPREMACPCFCPRQPRTGAVPPASALLPLGDFWTGVCLAQPGDPVEPGDACLSLCNLGYARGSCARFPASTGADAVRFAIAREDGRSLEIHFVLERGHHPFDHGQIEYHLEGDDFQPPLPATALAGQARAYAASYLRRKRDSAGSG